MFNHKATPKLRAETVQQLNDPNSDIKGVVITPQTGGVGLNMPGASLIVFMGSMYSLDHEAQAVCELPSLNGVDPVVARLCREGQRKIPKAYMIINASFKGDMAAISLKMSRGEELRNLTDLLSAEEIAQLAKEEKREEPGSTGREQMTKDNSERVTYIKQN